ncbi:hypothetical protein [Prolixibacter denitrificans]|uniref:Uncharacterized protein n=1 Tax=Prolixibacter denitrificans TaxID=1541063 RepID=A0A2P8C849_9BACT|nr:hypothetical protein [Prolixibacter denitrificans]PSK81153.1 hypothetical protein CLV93_111130 [Prolixibacter denitrificans]GET22269.1 hypothetical protein JCM18694_25150 [Prolixibacter denitrificans]
MTLLNTFNGFLTPLIAIIATYIAYQQYKANKSLEKKRLSLEEYKLKLELYNKRYRIFQETKELLFNIVKKVYVNPVVLRDFRFNTNESKFLFDDDIIQFLEELTDKAIDLNQTEDELKNTELYPIGTEIREQKNKENGQLRHWFNTNYESIESRFDKYLNFKNL